jgi:hypothetical protein
MQSSMMICFIFCIINLLRSDTVYALQSSLDNLRLSEPSHHNVIVNHDKDHVLAHSHSIVVPTAAIAAATTASNPEFDESFVETSASTAVATSQSIKSRTQNRRFVHLIKGLMAKAAKELEAKGGMSLLVVAPILVCACVYIHIYIYVCECVCMCVRMHVLFADLLT